MFGGGCKDWYSKEHVMVSIGSDGVMKSLGRRPDMIGESTAPCKSSALL